MLMKSFLMDEHLYLYNIHIIDLYSGFKTKCIFIDPLQIHFNHTLLNAFFSVCAFFALFPQQLLLLLLCQYKLYCLLVFTPPVHFSLSRQFRCQWEKKSITVSLFWHKIILFKYFYSLDIVDGYLYGTVTSHQQTCTIYFAKIESVFKV